MAPATAEPAASAALAPALQGHRGEELYAIAIPDPSASPAALDAAERAIEAFADGLLARKRDWLQTVLDRSMSYRGLVTGMLEDRGMPRELAFLPAIESGFNPRATSPVGAAGLWQLMRNTSGPLGLRTDEWLDERRDIWRSTEAALTKLAGDRDRFGSWEMALAAYNCGGGKLTSIVTAQGSKDYWELRRRGAFPAETASFVPQFVAAARILSYPGRNGLSVSWQPDPQWERVAVERCVDLRLLAREAGVPYQALQGGNPELVLAVTPPQGYGYQLKVPAESRDAVERALASAAIPLLEYEVYVVRKGDTLWQISRRFGVSLELLEESNPAADPGALRIGSRLLVPKLAAAPGGRA